VGKSSALAQQVLPAPSARVVGEGLAARL